MRTFRTLLAEASTDPSIIVRLSQWDVTCAFLHADIDAQIYLEQPEGFIDASKPDHVFEQYSPLENLRVICGQHWPNCELGQTFS